MTVTVANSLFITLAVIARGRSHHNARLQLLAWSLEPDKEAIFYASRSRASLFIICVNMVCLKQAIGRGDLFFDIALNLTKTDHIIFSRVKPCKTPMY